MQRASATHLPASLSQNRREHPRALAALGVIIALLALGGIASNEFVEWDDSLMIARNPNFSPPTFESVLPYALPKNAALYLYIPLTEYFWGALSFVAYVDAIDTNGSHLNPWVFHSASIAVHLLGSLIVFACLRRMLRALDDDHPTLWPAWVGAMVFAVHPIQIEAVAWASGMKDVLSGFFVLLCIYCFLRFREQDSTPGRPQRWYVIALFCLIAANLSKSGAVATPLVVLVIDIVLLKTAVRRSLTALWPWFALMIPVVILTKHVQPTIWTDLAPTPIYLRPLVAGDALAFYIGKLVAPIRLSFDYNRSPEHALAGSLAYIDWIVPLAVILIGFKARKNRLLLAGIGVFIAALMPVLGFIPFESQIRSTVSDHYLYPAMLGVAMCAAWSITRFRGWWMTAFVWIALGGWTIISAQAGQIWHDNERLCRHALAIEPDSWNALTGLGASLDHNGDAAGAESMYKRSIALNPRNGITHLDLALLLIREDRAEEALFQLREMTHYYQMQSNADHSVVEMAHIAIAAMMLKHQHPDLAIEACHEALAIDPNDTRAIALLARANESISHPSTLPQRPS